MGKRSRDGAGGCDSTRKKQHWLSNVRNLHARYSCTCTKGMLFVCLSVRLCFALLLQNYVGKVIPAGTHGCMVSCVTGKELHASKEAQDLMTQVQGTVVDVHVATCS